MKQVAQARVGMGLGMLATLALGAATLGAWAAAQAPVEVPRGKLADLNWVALPEFGGAEAILYRSPDGKRVAAAFRESGKATFTYPFDEFLYVTSGTVTIRVHCGETFTLSAGHVAYFREGTTVDFDFSQDFSDVTMLVADHEVKWR